MPRHSVASEIRELTCRRERRRVLERFLGMVREELGEAHAGSILDDMEAKLREVHGTFTSAVDGVAAALAEEHFRVAQKDEAAAAVRWSYRDFVRHVPAAVGPAAAARLQVPMRAPAKPAGSAKALRGFAAVLSRPGFLKAVETPSYVSGFDAESQAEELVSVAEIWEKATKRLGSCRARLRQLRQARDEAKAEFDARSAAVVDLLRALFTRAEMDGARRQMEAELREARR